MNLRPLIAVLAVTLTGASAVAKEIIVTDRFTQELPIEGAASILVNNDIGNVEIYGTSSPNLSLVAEKTVRGVDQKAVDEGFERTELRRAGDAGGYMFTTILPTFRSPRWTSSVKYTLRVPRTIDVKVISVWSERILVNDIRGGVTITNVTGSILLQNLTGSSVVDSANGSITFIGPPRGLSNATLRTVNGSIDVRVPGDANFQWNGESGTGDIRTTFPVRLRSFGNNGFRGNVNAAGGPTMITATLMGTIFVMQNGAPPAAAKLVRPSESNVVPASGPLPLTAPIDRGVVEGLFAYDTSLGSIKIREIRGVAKLRTGAGEVNLGLVRGDCQVYSGGGPLNLGEIYGLLNARTEAGDVLVQAANRGGVVTTGGGIIRMLYTNGPTRLQSGGGDIVVRQAAAPIIAETRSGDITITLDPTSKSEKIWAKTSKGNVLLNIPTGFSGDIDATVLTSDPDANHFTSDFPQLSVQRDQFNGKIRLRITGKVNGGGQKIELFAEGGGIQISSNAPTAISVIAPR